MERWKARLPERLRSTVAIGKHGVSLVERGEYSGAIAAGVPPAKTTATSNSTPRSTAVPSSQQPEPLETTEWTSSVDDATNIQRLEAALKDARDEIEQLRTRRGRQPALNVP